MKIACEACEAKYSIADEKVRGKLFKLRCKKCSNVIVVRGVSEDPPIGIWHLVIAGEQVGPFTVEQAREKILDGNVTLAWREGRAEWLPVAEIAELAPNAPPAPDAPDNKLRGERNESSVLFSLGNLAKIAVSSSDQPQQEGSGLIDIRSMASAYRGDRAPIASPDLPVFATPAAFSEPAVLVPLPTRVEKSRLLYILAAAVIALATVAVILLVLVLQHETPMIAAAPPIIRITQAAPAPVAVVAPPKPEEPKPETKPAPPAAPPRPHRVAVAPPPPKQPECDDVKCVITGDVPCCAKPPALTAAMTTAPMSAIRARAMACRANATGRVRIHVKVGGDGHVDDATVETTPDPELGRCVAAAVRRAQFPQTVNGGSFGVPYNF